MVSIDAGLKTAIDGGEAMYPLLIAIQSSGSAVPTTVTGNPIVISDGKAGSALTQIDATLQYSQDGSGDATPSNPRPITAFNSFNLTVTGGGTASASATFPYGVAVGTLNAVTGALTTTKKYVLGSSLTWTKYNQSAIPSGLYGYYATIPDKAFGVTNIVSSHFTAKNVTWGNMTDGGMRGLAGNHNVYCIVSGHDTLAKFTAWLASKNVQFVYDLESSVSATISPIAMTIYGGNNTISANTGEITITYSAQGSNIKVFTSSDIWQGQFSVERDSTNGSAPEIGTTIAAECNIGLRYDASIMQWLTSENELCMFVGCRSHYDYDTQLPDIVTDAASATHDFLYVGIDTASYKYGHLYSLGGTDLGVPLCPLGIYFPDKVKASKYSITVIGLDCLSLLDEIVPSGGYGAPAIQNTFSYLPQSAIISGINNHFAAQSLTVYMASIGPMPDIWQPYAGISNQKTYRQVLQYLGQIDGIIFGASPARRRYITRKDFYNNDNGGTPVRYDCSAANRYSLTVNALTKQKLGYAGLNDGNEDYYSPSSIAAEPYGIMIQGNPWVKAAPSTVSGVDIRQGYADALDALVGNTASAISYLPFNASIKQTPYLDTYDVVQIYDADGTIKYSTITNFKYKLNSPTDISCAGENIQASQLTASSGTAGIVKQAVTSVQTGSVLINDITWGSGTQTILHLEDYTLFLVSIFDSTATDHKYNKILCSKQWSLGTSPVTTYIAGSMQVQDGTTINGYRVMFHYTGNVSGTVTLDYAYVGNGTSPTTVYIKEIKGIL